MTGCIADKNKSISHHSTSPPACFDDHLALRSGTAGHCGTTLLTIDHKCQTVVQMETGFKRNGSICVYDCICFYMYIYIYIYSFSPLLRNRSAGWVCTNGHEKKKLWICHSMIYVCIRYNPLMHTRVCAPSSRHHARHCAEQSLQTHRCPITSGLSKKEPGIHLGISPYPKKSIYRWNFGWNLQVQTIWRPIFWPSMVRVFFSGEASTEFLPVLVAVLPPVCPCLERAGCADL